MFRLKLFGLSPSGKQRVITLYLPIHQMEKLAAELKKAIKKQKEGLAPEEVSKERVRYIG